VLQCLIRTFQKPTQEDTSMWSRRLRLNAGDINDFIIFERCRIYCTCLSLHVLTSFSSSSTSGPRGTIKQSSKQCNAEDLVGRYLTLSLVCSPMRVPSNFRHDIQKASSFSRSRWPYEYKEKKGFRGAIAHARSFR